MEIDKIYQGDCLEVLKTFEDNSIDCCVTSPPYYALVIMEWMRKKLNARTTQI